MSGIVGIVNLDGEPVAQDLLCRLTKSMAVRGPDAQTVWVERNVGFGHTLLRTTFEAETEKQPTSVDGNLWLVSDSRIDGREKLIAELESTLPRNLHLTAGSTQFSLDSRVVNDAELILHSYRAWGEDCVRHLIGDFTFAIWDKREQRLFCARDQMGVRQFYYTHNQRWFAFSNSLECLRLHPDVSLQLNDQAIGDFLLFGENREQTTTSFSDIQRLPQAQSLTLTRRGISTLEYWSAQTFSIQHNSPEYYIEEFREIFAKAVRDRLRTKDAAISLSGGLDSTSVAATALHVARKLPHAFEVKGYCADYKSFRDDERRCVELVSEGLNIPTEFLDAESLNLQNNRRTLGFATEPFEVDPIYVVSDELLRRMAERSRVALTGWDGDTFMSETPRHYFAHLLKHGHFVRLGTELIAYVYAQQALPPIGLRTAWKKRKAKGFEVSGFPGWLNETFARKNALKERWQQVNADSKPQRIRPRAFTTLYSAGWRSLFARFDAGNTRLPLEVRHPLIDVRMVEYLLSIPIIPWLLDKAILRKAMIGILPDEIRLRPKTPLIGDPGVLLNASEKFKQIDSFKPVPDLLNYVVREAVPRIWQETDATRLWINVRPYSLNQWLTNSYQVEPKNHSGVD